MPFSLSIGLGTAGLIVLAIYLVLFYKTIESLPTGQQDFYAKLGRNRRTIFRNLIGTLLIFSFFFTENIELRIFLTIIIFVSLALGTILHHKFLEENGFAPLFLRRLFKITFLAAFAMFLLMASRFV